MNILFENTITLIFLAICSIFDMKYKRVPLVLFITTACLGIVWHIFYEKYTGEQWIVALCSVAIGGLLLFISIITKGGLGIGDAFTFCVLGLFYDVYFNMTLMCVSFFLSALCGIYLLIIQKKKKNSEIALIPFVYVACAALSIAW